MIYKERKPLSREDFGFIGENVKIYPSAVIVNAGNLRLGNNVTIGDHVFLNAGKKTVIEDKSQLNAGVIVAGGGELFVGQNVVVSYNVVILTGTDSPAGLFMCNALPESLRAVVRGRIEIQDNVFIGANTVVTVCRKRPNITIGEGAVVASQIFLDKDVYPRTLVIPEQKLSFRRREYR